MDYCIWTTNCTAVGSRKEGALLDAHICCFTCKKKASCAYACKDRDKGQKCRYQCSAQDVNKMWAPKKYVPAVATAAPTRKILSPEEMLRAQQAEQQAFKDKHTSKVAAKRVARNSTSKTVPTKSTKVPVSVKELAAMTGATYARANYYINTKKLSYEEALKILKSS